MPTVAIYIFAIVAGAAIFPLLFNSAVFASCDLLFYRGIALALTCAIAQSLTLVAIRCFSKFRIALQIKDILCIAALTFSFNITFLIVFPVTIDRSISTYLLFKLETASNEGLTKEELEQEFKKEYVTENEAIYKRMKEQIVTGNVMRNGESYILTPQGKKFLGFCEVVAKVFGIAKRPVLPVDSGVPDLPASVASSTQSR